MSAQAHVERIKLYGTSGSADAYVIRDFLQRSVVQFAWIELNRDEQARQKAAIDSLVTHGCQSMRFLMGHEAPTLQQVADKLRGSPGHATPSTT